MKRTGASSGSGDDGTFAVGGLDVDGGVTGDSSSERRPGRRGGRLREPVGGGVLDGRRLTLAANFTLYDHRSPGPVRCLCLPASYDDWRGGGGDDNAEMCASVGCNKRETAAAQRTTGNPSFDWSQRINLRAQNPGISRYTAAAFCGFC